MVTSLIEGQTRPNREYISFSPVNIVHLTPDQWSVLRDVKISSIEQEPIAFADAETERAKYLSRSEAEWRAILEGKMSGGRQGETIMLFAEKEGSYVGMVSAIIPQGQTTATIQHMFVDKESRGLGIGKKLLASLLAELRKHGGLEKAELSVVEKQMPARRLYEKLGFTEERLVEGGARRGNLIHNEIEMALELYEQ